MKTKIAIGSLIAAILPVIAGLVLILKHYYAKADKQLSWVAEANLFDWSMMLSIAVGIVLNIWLIGIVIRRLLAGQPSVFGTSVAARTGNKIGAYAAGICSYPFALFLGFVAGGSLGGGWGEVLLGKAGIPVGIGLGLFSVMTTVSVVAVAMGFVVGGLIEKLVKILSRSS